MTVRPEPGSCHPDFPHSPAIDRLAHDDEAVAFRHEHGRLYDALERAAQIAELAGHDDLAASLRRDRHGVSGELALDACDGALRPEGVV